MELTGTLAHLVDLVLPATCVGCGRPGVALCPVCLDSVPIRCTPVGGRPVVAGAAYDGAVRAALLRFKERGRRDLLRPLAGLLAAALEECARTGPEPRPWLVPVPTSRAGVRSRGYDPVALLVRSAARRGDVRAVRGALRLDRAVADSAGLGADARALNLDHAFRAVPPPPGRVPQVLVVDDIVTTGATAREAVRALTAAGWTVAGVAAVAATPAPGRSGTRSPRDRHPPASRGSPIGRAQAPGLAW